MEHKNFRASIIIPALNEEQSIGLVLDEIPRGKVEQIIVVDNSSTDNTAEIAERHGATVVREERKGYGAACLRGLASINSNADIVVILDADHSDYPEDLHKVLRPIQEGHTDLAIGSRLASSQNSGALPWNQRLGNRLACFLINLLYRRRFTDMGPFRAIRKDALDRLSMRDQTFGWNAEMQVRAMIEGLKIVEVPVRYRSRIGRSKISGTVKGTVLAGIKIISTILKLYPHYLRKKWREK